MELTKDFSDEYDVGTCYKIRASTDVNKINFRNFFRWMDPSLIAHWEIINTYYRRLDFPEVLYAT